MKIRQGRSPSKRFKVWRGILLAVTGVTIALVILALLAFLLGPFSWMVAGDPVQQLGGKDQADALNAVRQTVLTAIAGTTVLIGLIFTGRTFYLARRSQVTDRFGRAVVQLASDRAEERLGGVYALEHVMAESARDHITVVNVLATFVRARTQRLPAKKTFWLRFAARRAEERLPPDTEPSADVAAALAVLARRPERYEPHRVDLRRTALPGLMLRAFEFTHPPRLSRMFLTWSDLRGADLRGVDLRGSMLSLADLRRAALHGVRLDGAQLRQADLRGTHLGGASLVEADFTGADLRDAAVTAAQLASAIVDETTRFSAALAADPWVRARVAACTAVRALDDGTKCPKPTPNPATRHT
ncbi:pentapeptide repeat-containing protein [Nonomuraea basaltis]|uniref:pentapeptide repeat-containing protein n=1 Tax=Nonomuraea basaltis TaxID=2495887 RepID=UPI00110C50E0|nr:pentapeptide repeat-containing protein [Nonomuraea basaltis]TMR91563.1 pentapeptide repeat-containing protein [Nonomuraea basaltis]